VGPHQKIFHLTVSSSPRQITRVETFLKRIGKVVTFNDIQFHKLMVSLTEAVNNGIIHGNKSDPKKKVFVTAELLPGWILFMIDDEGRGFKPDKVKNPLSEENLTRESGRGIFLMKTLMDRVEFEIDRKGTHVRLWLDLNK
jgi:serine/threonine-protein kinase RsbW